MVTRKLERIKRTISGVGIHEVIIETPDHSESPPLLSGAEFELVVQAYHRRYNTVAADPRVAQVTVFKNQGEAAAGTSLAHPHSQLLGTPIIPAQVRDRMEHSLRFYDETGECLFCSVLADEMRDQTRIVAMNAEFVAFVPYAALTPFHLWIYPLHHRASFRKPPTSSSPSCRACSAPYCARFISASRTPTITSAFARRRTRFAGRRTITGT